MTVKFITKYQGGWTAQAANELDCVITFFPQRPGPRTLVLKGGELELWPGGPLRVATELMRVDFPPFCLVVSERNDSFYDMRMMEMGDLVLRPDTLLSKIYTPNGGGRVCLGSHAKAIVDSGTDPVDLFWNSTWYGPRRVWVDEGHLYPDVLEGRPGRFTSTHQTQTAGRFFPDSAHNEVSAVIDLPDKIFSTMHAWEWRWADGS